MCGFDTLPLSLTRLVEYWRLRLRAKFDILGFRTLRGVRSKAKEQKRFFFSFQKSQQPKIHAANQKQPTRINKMRRTNNAEQVSPSRRSLRRRKRNDQLNDYDVCMNGPGRRGKEYKMCKNLMNSFNECEEEGNIELSGGEEHGNNAQMFGDNAAQNAARDMPVDSNASEHSIYEQGQDQDENQDEAVREDLNQFLNDNDDCLQVPSGEDEEEWRELRKRFNEAIAFN